MPESHLITSIDGEQRSISSFNLLPNKSIILPDCQVDGIWGHAWLQVLTRGDYLFSFSTATPKFRGFCVLADREYVGRDWFEVLNQIGLLFIIRLSRQDYKYEISGGDKSYGSLLRSALKGKVVSQSVQIGQGRYEFVAALHQDEPDSADPTLSNVSAGKNLQLVDVDQMEQVLVNVVKNALEACEAGQHVEVISTVRYLLIRNNGQPIPEHIAPNLFNPFYSNKPEGQGIGPTLTREILLNHKLSLSLRTNEEDWMEFLIEFV